MSMNIVCVLSVDVFLWNNSIWLASSNLPSCPAVDQASPVGYAAYPLYLPWAEQPYFPWYVPKDPWGRFSLPLSLCPFFYIFVLVGFSVFSFLFLFPQPILSCPPPPPLSVLRYNIISTLRKGKANSCHLKAINVIRLDVFHMYLSLAESISHDSGDFLLIGMSWALIALWRLCDVSVWSGLLLWNSMCTSTTPLAWSVHQSACHLDPFHTTTHILQQAHTLQQANIYYC